jgi:hypothetical protein
MLQELDSRDGDGISVTLLWDNDSRQTLIQLIDDRNATTETFVVAPHSAADAFAHPFCYLTRPKQETPKTIARPRRFIWGDPYFAA